MAIHIKGVRNKRNDFECDMCDYKASCWPDAIQRPSAMSLAKNPPMVYYTELKYAKDDIKNTET